MKRELQKGFTLLEMLFVVVIIGVLSGIVGPRYFEQLMKTENNAALTQLSSFRRALDVFLLDNGFYPSTEQGLQALITAPENAIRWAGPYLEKNQVPSDPWGNAYVYSCPSMSSEYSLYSTGRDVNDPDDDISVSTVAESSPGAAASDDSAADDTSGTDAAAADETATAMAYIDPQGFTDVVGIIQ